MLFEAPPVPLPRSAAVQLLNAPQPNNTETPPVSVNRPLSVDGCCEIPPEAPPVPLSQSATERMHATPPGSPLHSASGKVKVEQHADPDTWWPTREQAQRWWIFLAETLVPTGVGLAHTGATIGSNSRVQVVTGVIAVGLGRLGSAQASEDGAPRNLQGILNEEEPLEQMELDEGQQQAEGNQSPPPQSQPENQARNQAELELLQAYRESLNPVPPLVLGPHQPLPANLAQLAPVEVLLVPRDETHKSRKRKSKQVKTENPSNRNSTLASSSRTSNPVGGYISRAGATQTAQAVATVAAQSVQHQQGSGDGAGSGTTGNQVVTRRDGSGSGTGGGSGATAAGGPPEGSGTTAEQGNAGGSGSGSKDGERPSQGAKQKSGRSTASSSDSDSSNDRGGNNTRRAPARYVHEFYAMDGARTRLRVHRVIITPTNGQVAPGAGWHIFTALLSEGFYILLPFGRTERFAPESNQADWSFLLGSLRHRRLHDLEIPGWQGFNRQSGVVVSEAARTCLPVLWQGKLQPLLYVPTPDLVPQAEAGSSHAGRNDNTANVSYTAQATRAQAAGATAHTAQMALDTADLTAAAAYAARDMLRAAQPRPDIVSVHIAPLPGPTLLSPQRNGDSANAGATQHVRGLIRTLLLADRILHDENRYLAGEVPHRVTHSVEYLAVTNQAIVVTVFPQRQPDHPERYTQLPSRFPIECDSSAQTYNRVREQLTNDRNHTSLIYGFAVRGLENVLIRPTLQEAAWNRESGALHLYIAPAHRVYRNRGEELANIRNAFFYTMREIAHEAGPDVLATARSSGDRIPLLFGPFPAHSAQMTWDVVLDAMDTEWVSVQGRYTDRPSQAPFSFRPRDLFIVGFLFPQPRNVKHRSPGSCRPTWLNGYHGGPGKGGGGGGGKGKGYGNGYGGRGQPGGRDGGRGGDKGKGGKGKAGGKGDKGGKGKQAAHGALCNATRSQAAEALSYETAAANAVSWRTTPGGAGQLAGDETLMNLAPSKYTVGGQEPPFVQPRLWTTLLNLTVTLVGLLFVYQCHRRTHTPLSITLVMLAVTAHTCQAGLVPPHAAPYTCIEIEYSVVATPRQAIDCLQNSLWRPHLAGAILIHGNFAAPGQAQATTHSLLIVPHTPAVHGLLELRARGAEAPPWTVGPLPGDEGEAQAPLVDPFPTPQLHPGLDRLSTLMHMPVYPHAATRPPTTPPGTSTPAAIATGGQYWVPIVYSHPSLPGILEELRAAHFVAQWRPATATRSGSAWSTNQVAVRDSGPMPAWDGFLIMLPPPQMTAETAANNIRCMLTPSLDRRAPIAAPLHAPWSPHSSAALADAASGWISSRLMGPRHDVHPTRATLWAADRRGNVNTVNLEGGDSVDQVLEGLRADGKRTEGKRGAKEASVSDSPGQERSGARRNVRNTIEDRQMQDSQQDGPDEQTSPRRPAAPRALFQEEGSSVANATVGTPHTDPAEAPGEIEMGNLTKPTTTGDSESTTGLETKGDAKEDAQGEQEATQQDLSEERPESVDESEEDSDSKSDHSSTAGQESYFQGQQLPTSTTSKGGFGGGYGGPAAGGYGGQDNYDGLGRPFGAGPANTGLFSSTRTTATSNSRNTATAGGGGVGTSAPPRTTGPAPRQDPPAPSQELSFLTDMGFDLVSRTPGRSGGTSNSDGRFRIVLMHLPARMRTEQRIQQFLGQPLWRVAHGSWRELSQIDFTRPEVSLVELPARPGGRGRGRGRGATEPLHLAFITLEHEQVAAALLRANGTIRERGNGGRPIAIDIARSKQSSSGNQCYNCFQEGHFARECVSAAACRRCRQTGHSAADCVEAVAAVPGQRVCARCGDGTHGSHACHWSNETISTDSEQRTGYPSLTRWGNANEAAAGPTAGAAPAAPQPTNGERGAAWTTPAAGGQATQVSTPEMQTMTKRLEDLETRTNSDRQAMHDALAAQSSLMDTGFEEVRTNQAAAVTGLHAAITGNMTRAIATIGARSDSQFTQIMAMMSAATGLSAAPITGPAQPQITAGPTGAPGQQPLLGNGVNGTTTQPAASAPPVPHVTLAGHNFAGPTGQLLAPPEASQAYLDMRERARLTLAAVGPRREATAVLDGHTEPPPAGGDGQGAAGPPQ